jgi:hypothetical protein
MISSFIRDLKVWGRRIQECRNPLIWVSALNYERQRGDLLRFATKESSAVLAIYLREIEDDATFLDQIRKSLTRWTSYQPRAIDFMLPNKWGSVFFNEVTLYAIVRALKPKAMVETGGTPGKSTAFILRAMEQNKTGHLYTIDLAPQSNSTQTLDDHKTWHESIPKGSTSNWVVPETLRPRHTLLLGTSREQLPPLLNKLKEIDVFLHDSDHSYENMNWEFRTATPYIKQGGLLLSDDVLGNSSFFEFCQQTKMPYKHVLNLGAAQKLRNDL